MAGKVYLVGAGPGDKDLITVKGLRCIQTADVIIYDRLINRELLAEARPEAKLIYCGKLPHYHVMKQETINHFLIKYALEGKAVTRLKGGDPFIFGRGGEEALALAQRGIAFEVVPGITSGIAVPAYAGIPITQREVSASVAFVTGHRQAGDEAAIEWESLAKGIDTLVFYMGVAQLATISRELIAHGRASHTPAAIIHWGTTAAQQTVIATLGTLHDRAKASGVTNPSIIVVGDVVRFHEQLQWFITDDVQADEAASAVRQTT